MAIDAITINDVRCSYCHLFQPVPPFNNPQGEPKYSCTILVPKANTQAKALIDQAVAQAMAMAPAPATAAHSARSAAAAGYSPPPASRPPLWWTDRCSPSSTQPRSTPVCGVMSA